METFLPLALIGNSSKAPGLLSLLLLRCERLSNPFMTARDSFLLLPGENWRGNFLQLKMRGEEAEGRGGKVLPSTSQFPSREKEDLANPPKEEGLGEERTVKMEPAEEEEKKINLHLLFEITKNLFCASSCMEA